MAPGGPSGERERVRRTGLTGEERPPAIGRPQQMEEAVRPTKAQTGGSDPERSGSGEGHEEAPRLSRAAGKAAASLFPHSRQNHHLPAVGNGGGQDYSRPSEGLSPNPRRFPTAKELLAIPDEALRGAGLSKSKMRAIRDLAEKTESGKLKLRSLSKLPDDEVQEQLTAVWGIGEWSAQMFLLFHLGRLDVFAPGDLGLQEGIRMLDGLDERPTPASRPQRAEIWAPSGALPPGISGG